MRPAEKVRDAIHDFDRRGLDALVAGSSRPKQTHSAFDDEQSEALSELLYQDPRNFGKEDTFWKTPSPAPPGAHPTTLDRHRTRFARTPFPATYSSEFLEEFSEVVLPLLGVLGRSASRCRAPQRY